MAPWNPFIPQASDLMDKSQGDILVDNETLNTFLNVNHVDFAATGEGKHKFVTLPILSPDPATTINDVALFTKLGSDLGTPKPTLCLRQSNSGTVNQFGRGIRDNETHSGWLRLPSGLLMKWQTVSIAGSQSPNDIRTNSFFWFDNNLFPAFSATPFSMTATIINLSLASVGAIIKVRAVSATEFTVTTSLRQFVQPRWQAFQVYIIGFGRGA